MYIQSGIVRFTETVNDELARLTSDLRLMNILPFLQKNDVPEELKSELRGMMGTLIDLFGNGVPVPDDSDPVETLRTASRDINLGRILRERGLFRLYHMLNSTVQVDGAEIPMFNTLLDPNTGAPFRRREDLMIWFCQEAHVARSLVFMRLGTIDKLASLGFSLEEAYQIILPKPFAVRKTLRSVATWDDNQLVGVNPIVAANLTERLQPDKAAEVRELSDVLEDQDADEEEHEDARQRLNETMKPIIAQLVQEVSSHPSIKDAMDMVEHDVLAKPEIKYFWNAAQDALQITLHRKEKDSKGVLFEKEEIVVLLVSEKPLPYEIKRDLLERLPVSNRELADRPPLT